MGRLTLTEIETRIDELMDSPTYKDEQHPRHKNVAKQVQQLVEGMAMETMRMQTPHPPAEGAS